MIPSASAEVVLFGIRSAIRLGQQARAAYLDNTRGRALTLPLPDFTLTVDTASAIGHFQIRIEGGDAVAPEIRRIVAKARTRLQDPAAPSLTDAEKDDLLLAFNEERLLEADERGGYTPLADGSYYDNRALSALVTIRQWRRGRERYPSAVQRLAGSFIEIGIDYFTVGPGRGEMKSEQEKALLAFLDGIDEIAFAETELADLPGRLMTAVLDTVATHPEFVSGSAAFQDVIKVTAAGLSEKVTALVRESRAAGGGNIARESLIRDRAEEVFRTVLATAGQTVLADPEKFLGIGDKGAGALVRNVGEAMLDLALQSETGQMYTVFGAAGLRAITGAALDTLAAHPDLIAGGNVALAALLQQITRDLHGFESLVAPGLTARVMQVVLRRSGENLALFWPDAANDPKKNLLLAAAKTTLALVASGEVGAGWRPRLEREHLVQIVETVLDAIVENPGWLIDGAGARGAALEILLTSTLAVLEKHDDVRLAPETLKSILVAALHAGARRAEFLEPFEGGPLRVTAVLDFILEAALDNGQVSRVSTVLMKQSALRAFIEASLTALSSTGLDDNVIKVFKEVLEGRVAGIAGGEPFALEHFVDELRAALDANH
ncbi:hypothetical protein [Nisaea sp.]|uniref:hypothetical protein n=1 Tax=Nisaea sp. TaxID=2024842 RepID=UPI003B527E56